MVTQTSDKYDRILKLSDFANGNMSVGEVLARSNISDQEKFNLFVLLANKKAEKGLEIVITTKDLRTLGQLKVGETSLQLTDAAVEKLRGATQVDDYNALICFFSTASAKLNKQRINNYITKWRGNSNDSNKSSKKLFSFLFSLLRDIFFAQPEIQDKEKQKAVDTVIDVIIEQGYIKDISSFYEFSLLFCDKSAKSFADKTAEIFVKWAGKNFPDLSKITKKDLLTWAALIEVMSVVKKEEVNELLEKVIKGLIDKKDVSLFTFLFSFSIEWQEQNQEKIEKAIHEWCTQASKEALSRVFNFVIDEAKSSSKQRVAASTRASIIKWFRENNLLHVFLLQLEIDASIKECSEIVGGGKDNLMECQSFKEKNHIFVEKVNGSKASIPEYDCWTSGMFQFFKDVVRGIYVMHYHTIHAGIAAIHQGLTSVLSIEQEESYKKLAADVPEEIDYRENVLGMIKVLLLEGFSADQIKLVGQRYHQGLSTIVRSSFCSQCESLKTRFFDDNRGEGIYVAGPRTLVLSENRRNALYLDHKTKEVRFFEKTDGFYLKPVRFNNRVAFDIPVGSAKTGVSVNFSLEDKGSFLKEVVAGNDPAKRVLLGEDSEIGLFLDNIKDVFSWSPWKVFERGLLHLVNCAKKETNVNDGLWDICSPQQQLPENYKAYMIYITDSQVSYGCFGKGYSCTKVTWNIKDVPGLKEGIPSDHGNVLTMEQKRKIASSVFAYSQDQMVKEQCKNCLSLENADNSSYAKNDLLGHFTEVFNAIKVEDEQAAFSFARTCLAEDWKGVLSNDNNFPQWLRNHSEFFIDQMKKNKSSEDNFLLLYLKTVSSYKGANTVAEVIMQLAKKNGVFSFLSITKTEDAFVNALFNNGCSVGNLPTILTGITGTNKSFIQQRMFEHFLAKREKSSKKKYSGNNEQKIRSLLVDEYNNGGLSLDGAKKACAEYFKIFAINISVLEIIKIIKQCYNEEELKSLFVEQFAAQHKGSSTALSFRDVHKLSFGDATVFYKEFFINNYTPITIDMKTEQWLQHCYMVNECAPNKIVSNVVTLLNKLPNNILNSSNSDKEIDVRNRYIWENTQELLQKLTASEFVRVVEDIEKEVAAALEKAKVKQGNVFLSGQVEKYKQHKNFVIAQYAQYGKAISLDDLIEAVISVNNVNNVNNPINVKNKDVKSVDKSNVKSSAAMLEVFKKFAQQQRGTLGYWKDIKPITLHDLLNVKKNFACHTRDAQMFYKACTKYNKSNNNVASILFDDGAMKYLQDKCNLYGSVTDVKVLKTLHKEEEKSEKKEKPAVNNPVKGVVNNPVKGVVNNLNVPNVVPVGMNLN